MTLTTKCLIATTRVIIRTIIRAITRIITRAIIRTIIRAQSGFLPPKTRYNYVSCKKCRKPILYACFRTLKEMQLLLFFEEKCRRKNGKNGNSKISRKL